MTLGEARAKYRFKCPVLKIHGCVNHPSSIVLSRNAYKRLKHETPGYKMFLTTAMATSTMLYIGFSFTDDYLNDFRAEVLSMLRPRRSTLTSACAAAATAAPEPQPNDVAKVAKDSKLRLKKKQELPIGYAIIEGRLKHDCAFFRCSTLSRPFPWGSNANTMGHTATPNQTPTPFHPTPPPLPPPGGTKASRS